MVAIKCLLIVTPLLITVQSIPFQDNETENNEATEEFQENPYRLSKHVVPMHYNIKLILHIEGNFTFNGETSIDIKVRKKTNFIALHTVLLTIDESLTRLSRKDGNDVNNYIPKQHDYNSEMQILTVQFKDFLDPGIYTLYLKFVGEIRDYYRGFYKSFYIDNEGKKIWLAATHFQPMSARQAFPCWDEPAMKATFKFSIKHYPNYTALSNMPSTRSNVDAADGKVWTYFETTPIMSTNVLGFVIADYDHVSNLDGTIKIWGPKHLLNYAAYPLDIAEKATQELEKFTNGTVGVPKMDHVSVPHYSSRATENWGMIVYKQDVLLRDENLYLNNNKLLDTMTITHELAHQWFGNLVSPIWWNHLWLSEGMSNYFKVYITDKFLKEWRLMDWYVLNDIQLLLRYDSSDDVKPIVIKANVNHMNVFEAYSYINTYMKSAALLRMASHFLSEDVFRNGIIKYLQIHEYSNVTPDDLWKALQDALDESDVPHNDFKVKEVMDTWFEQEGYPLVTINRDYTTGEIRATQERFLIKKSDNTEKTGAWWIPLNFATKSNLDFSTTLATHWLKPQDESVTIEGVDINDWIIVNKQLTGFYRVNYDTINWKRIAAFLNSDNYSQIPVPSRLQIIDDAYYMTVTEQLDVITFLEIINYLCREIDIVIWLRIFEMIETLNDFLQLPEAATTFTPYLFNSMSKLLEHFDFDEHPDDDPLTIQFKSKLYKYACIYEHSKCRAATTAKLLAYVDNPNINKFLYNEKSIVCFGLMNANESIWDQFQQIYKETHAKYYHYFGCSKNNDINKKYLNSTKTEDLINDYDYIFHNMLDYLPNVDEAIDIFINNFDKIATNINSGYILHKIILKSTGEQIEKIKPFAEQYSININNDLTDREKKLAKIRDYLSRIQSALENNEFSIPLHSIPNNDASQPNITEVQM